MLPLIYKRTLTAVILLLFLYQQAFPQHVTTSINRYRRDPAIGLHYSMTTFTTGSTDIGKINHGYLLSFLDGFNSRYDYMIQAGSIAPKYPIGKIYDNDRHLLHLLSIQAIRRIFMDSVLINPFAAIGTGITLYDTHVQPLANVGAGFQLRVSKTAFIHTQLNYQWNFSSAVNNSTTLSIGFLGTIRQRRKYRAITGNDVTSNQQQLSDRDNDGIVDNIDDCPDVPGPRTFNGCPDTDADGIPDNKDKCPSEPGIIEYVGCPAPIEKKTSISTIDTLYSNNKQPFNTDSLSTVINSLAQHIYFESNKATLTPVSDKALTEIVALLKMLSFKQLLIEGHTDNTGTTKRNRQLSEERARAVLLYLANAGISKNHLTTKGFGAAQPIADNATPTGRAMNRRTVFVLYP